MIDISGVTYSDLLKYRADYLSGNQLYNITDEELQRLSNAYGMDCSGFAPVNKRIRI